MAKSLVVFGGIALYAVFVVLLCLRFGTVFRKCSWQGNVFSFCMLVAVLVLNVLVVLPLS